VPEETNRDIARRRKGSSLEDTDLLVEGGESDAGRPVEVDSETAGGTISATGPGAWEKSRTLTR